jgi:ribosomal protein S18 acetylase RimI-like enzyme
MVSFTASLATRDDLDAVHALLATAGDALAAGGFDNWQPAYPMERLKADVAQGVVWAVRDARGALVATYMLRTAPVRPYEGIAWAEPDANARYLNRLAVHPTRQGEGIGRWCMTHMAESCARDGATVIRCDVVLSNLALCRFYERNGYEGRGERRHSGWDFTVYELQIGTADATSSSSPGP